MDKSLLVEIFTPTFVGDDGDGRGDAGEVGTGYPVGPELVLTARHVVAPAKRDPRYPIMVRWHDYPTAGPNDGWYAAELVWPGDDDLDAALLRCPRPAEAGRRWAILSAEMPRGGERWESAGFPKAARVRDRRQPASFQGRMFTMSVNAAHVEADTEVAPETETGWQCASGMPLCRQNTMTVLGIAKQVPRAFGSRRVHATPIWKLLREPSGTFGALVGHDRQERHLRRFEARLAALFEGCEAAIVALEERSALFADQPLDPRQRAADVARRLACAPIDSVIEGLHDVRDELLEELPYRRDAALGAAAEVMVHAIQLLLPCLYDHGVVGSVRSAQGAVSAALLTLPTTLPMVAEIIMAGADGRAAEYRPRASAQDYPEGIRHLPDPPETGMDPQARNDAIRQYLARKFGADDWSSVRGKIDDLLYERFVGAQAVGAGSPSDRKRTAQVEIGTRSRREKYYMIFFLPNEPGARMELEARVGELKADYPALVFLGLPEDGEIDLVERKRFGLARDMLPVRGGP